MTVKLSTLSDVAEINPLNKLSLSPQDKCSFVPMDSVDEVFGLIQTPISRFVTDVSKGYTPFRERDVLFAKITPCMENGKCAIAENLVNGYGFGSTEFHVLRANGEVKPEWIYYFLRQETVREKAKRRMTGSAGQQRVPDTFFDEVEILVPDLKEQSRIISGLNNADRLRRLRKYALDVSDSFLQSLFVGMFGDPVVNDKGWDVQKFEDVGVLDRGRSKHRPRDAACLYGGKYPFIQTGDIANCDNYILRHKQTYSDAGLKQSKLWDAGVLCITIAANIAKTGILTYPACFPDSVVGFIPSDSIRTEYVQYWLKFLQKILERTAPESAQKNINLEILRELKIPTPPLSMQDKFVDMVKKQRQARIAQKESLRQAEQLFQSLLHQAFSEN